MKSTDYLKIQHVKLIQAQKISDFWHQISDQMINWLKKDQQNASCQIIIHKFKIVLHLAKSKIYSKHHQLQFKNISNSLSQIHQNDLAQNLLHSNHSLNQISFWINLTVYSQACLMIWIVNSALNLHWSSNSIWLSFNSVTQLIKKMMNLTTINKIHHLKLSFRTFLWTSK